MLSRYVSAAEQELEVDLSATHKELVEIEIRGSTAKHNEFLKGLGLSLLPAPDQRSKRSSQTLRLMARGLAEATLNDWAPGGYLVEGGEGNFSISN